MTTFDSNPAAAPIAQRTKWLLLTALLLICAAGVIFIQFNQSLPYWLQWPATLTMVGGSVLLFGVWFFVTTGMRTPVRLMVLVATILLTFLMAIDSVRGVIEHRHRRMRPVVRIVVPDALMTGPVIATGAGLPPVDLSHTTPLDFPQFLGPGGHNTVTGVHLNPDWASHPPKELWRQPIGLGWSSFAVVNGFAVTMEQRGQRELTVCYELATGRARWVHSNPVRLVEPSGGDGPRATPTIRDGRVYVFGGTGILDCLDGATGNLIWSRNVLADAGAANLTWGKTSSPLVVDDRVIVTGGNKGPCLLAYQRDSGAPLWRAGTDRTAYSSPTLMTLCGTRQVVQINVTTVTGHDLTDGHLLWTFPWGGGDSKIANPIELEGDRVLISAGYGIGSYALQIKRTPDGTFTATTAWVSMQQKSKFSNHVVHDGYIYGLDETVLSCLNLSTGRKKWRGESYGYGQIMLVDDLLLIVAESGEVALVAASPDSFQELARFPALNSKSWSNPVVVGHRLLLRNDNEAACFELP